MSFHPVPTHVDSASVAVSRCRDEGKTPLVQEDPAWAAMTDFHSICPVTVAPEVRLGATLQKMIAAGVRTLLVMADNHMTGLITSYDIEGPKPLQFLNGSDCIHAKCQHEDIEVADLMTPLEALRTVRLQDVRMARIGDIQRTLRESRQTHLLVTDRQDNGRDLVRGLISKTEIERRTGMSPAHASGDRTEMESSVFPRLTA